MDPTLSDHTELPENDRIGETPGATRRHLMAPDQEMTYSLVRSSSLIPDNQFSSPATSIIAKLTPSTPGAPLLERAKR